jgi:hypothetical protein
MRLGRREAARIQWPPVGKKGEVGAQNPRELVVEALMQAPASPQSAFDAQRGVVPALQEGWHEVSIAPASPNAGMTPPS